MSDALADAKRDAAVEALGGLLFGPARPAGVADVAAAGAAPAATTVAPVACASGPVAPSGGHGTAPAAALARHPRCQPLQRRLGQFAEEARTHVVACLPVQHAGLRERQIQALACPGDRDVHQPPLLLQAAEFGHRALVRKQPLLQPGDEHHVELQTLGRVHRHQLHRIVSVLRLVVASLQRRVGEECGQRRDIGCRRAGSRRGDRHAVGVDQHRLRRLVGHRRQADTQIRRHVLLDALLGEERAGGVDQFAQVLDALLALALGLIERGQPRGIDHLPDQFWQRQLTGLRAQPFDQCDEAGELLRGRAAHCLHRRIQAQVAGARRILQLFERACANAACREVDDPQQRTVVVGVLHQPQVGQRVLDLGPLEEAQPAVDPVRHAGREQRVLDDP